LVGVFLVNTENDGFIQPAIFFQMVSQMVGNSPCTGQIGKLVFIIRGSRTASSGNDIAMYVAFVRPVVATRLRQPL
jgi:hypothetical protein